MPAGTSQSKGKQVEVMTIEDDGFEDEDGQYAMDGDEWDAYEEYDKPEKVEGTAEEQAELEQLKTELEDVNSQINELRNLRSTLATQRDTLRATIASRQSVKSKLKAVVAQKPQPGAIDYTKGSYPWSAKALGLAQEIWGIEKWRLAQEGAINATLAGKEVVAILPTGGGKSLIYQIPALLSSGTTVVITPLISLMSDQVSNLRSRDVAAECIHASTPQDEVKAILKRMLGSAAGPAKGKGKKKIALEDEEAHTEVKLVYVTPERIDKAKSFVNTLQKMYDANLLARFVIDEAHCVSTMGHDYRTAYLSLKKLKALFPKVPILAVTATAPQKVISDMLKTLDLPRQTSPGDAVLPNTTVLFTAPLYRPNLRYSIIPKPSSAAAVIDSIVDYILENHRGETGIIYTLSRADAEAVAKGVNGHDRSKGKLRAAVYHAYIEDSEKIRVQEAWKSKKINVVVATNASFGLGIDNPSVRFVIHHSLAKSLEGFYQESGRAGRDGLASDCLTYWRAADASRLSNLTYETFNTGGKEKLYDVVRFAENKTTCRKLLFSKYFSTAYDREEAFDAVDGKTPCGHCDNCLRDPSTVSPLDISLQAYRALRIISASLAQKGTLTLPQAADLVRGNGGGGFATQETNGKGKGKIDVVAEAGAKVTLSKDLTEQMLLRLLVEGYLQEQFHATAYNVSSYLRPSPAALRFTRLLPSQVSSADDLPTSLSMSVFDDAAGGKGKKRKGSTATGVGAGGSKPVRKKAKKAVLAPETDEEDGDEYGTGASSGGGSGGGRGSPAFEFDDEEEDADALEAMRGFEPSSDGVDEDGWASVKITSKSSRSNGSGSGSGGGGGKKKKPVEVLELD